MRRAVKKFIGFMPGLGGAQRNRKKIYLPDFTIALIYTPFLSPRYASFYVPLSFNKLDLRNYLKELYGVSVVHVRSYVEQQKVTRAKRFGKMGYGPWRRPISRKRMTVEMTEPFVWPNLPDDMSEWEQEQYNLAYEYESEYQKKRQPDADKEADATERSAFRDSAAEIRSGGKDWRPTWQALGLNYDRTSLWKKGNSTGPDS